MNNETTLNIGLNVGGSTMSYWTALFALMHYLPEDVHFACEVAQSNTEPTLVVSIPGYQMKGSDLYQLSLDLKQDCIAVRDFNGGRLVGPRASEWGPFNPQYFIEMSSGATV
jgi:hypothetical protein